MTAQGISRGERSRARLLEAATRAFAQRGYNDTKVSDIVADAGVSQPTFYTYFESKEAAFDALVETFCGDLRELVKTCHINETETVAEVAPRIRQNLAAIFAFLARDPEMTKIALIQSSNAEEIKRELTEIVHQNLQASQKLGVIRADLPTNIAADAIVGMVERLTLRYLFTGEREAEDLAALAINIILLGTLGEFPPRI